MESNIEALKHYVYELEYALAEKNTDIIKNVSRKIKENVTALENEVNRVNNNATGVYYKHINTIEFLVKPVEVDKPYEGNYLEQYAAKRAYELERSKALSGHDKFWTEHSVLKTNVFGLVPVEMIPEASTKMLLEMGWKKVNVDVLDFGVNTKDLRQVYSFCDQNFENYLALKEKSTMATVVLKFAA